MTLMCCTLYGIKEVEIINTARCQDHSTVKMRKMRYKSIKKAEMKGKTKRERIKKYA